MIHVSKNKQQDYLNYPLVRNIKNSNERYCLNNNVRNYAYT